MKKLQALNKRTAPKSVMPEKIIQFGEGNFLRAFVDWIIYNMNQKTDFNGSVVVVQPIEKGMVDWLNGQDCLYHVNLQGLDEGKPVNSLTRIDVISRALNPYTQNQAFMALADHPENRFVILSTSRFAYFLAVISCFFIQIQRARKMQQSKAAKTIQNTAGKGHNDGTAGK